jgi:propanediol dehydratase small subunit
VDFDPRSDYPLGAQRPELATTPSGVPLGDVTLDAVRTGRVAADDIRATPETLRLQAEVARSADREALAANLERAAELAAVPAETILEIYTALRPGRASGAELVAWAERLDTEFSAPLVAAFVREAAAAYADRGLLREHEHEPAPAV